MTGDAALVYVCGVLAAECLVALLILAVDATRERGRRRVWENAMRLAALAPALVAQVAAEVGPDIPAAVDHIVSIDALHHDALVEVVLSQEVREAELVEQVQNTQADAIAVVAQALNVADAQHTEVIRQAKAKRRHWSTVKRLKGIES